MNIENEYSVILLMLRKIVNSNDFSERKKIEHSLVKRISHFKTRVQQIESRVNNIADQATKAQTTSKFERDFMIIDNAIDMMAKIQRMKRGDNDGDSNA